MLELLAGLLVHMTYKVRTCVVMAVTWWLILMQEVYSSNPVINFLLIVLTK